MVTFGWLRIHSPWKIFQAVMAAHHKGLGMKRNPGDGTSALGGGGAKTFQQKRTCRWSFE
jgi:hypothetical protein